jgi:hypothetical protein
MFLKCSLINKPNLNNFYFVIEVDEPVDSEDGLDVVGRVPRCVEDDDAIGRD